MNSQELGKFVAYKDAVLIDTFIEGRGSKLHDFSRHRNHGTIYGMKWLKGAGSFVMGDYVEVPDSASLDITDEITIAAWIKPSDDSKNMIVGKGGAYIFAYSPPDWNRGKLYFNYYNGTEWVGYTCSNTKIEDLTKFYHVAATYSRYEGIVRIFINGKLDVENTVTADKIAVNARPVEVGRVWDTWQFNGTIDEVCIYRRALTESEQKSSYYYSNPHKKPKPTCVTRRGVYRAVKNEGIELTGNSLKCVEVIV